MPTNQRDEDVIKLNVSGVRYEIKKNAVIGFPDSLLAEIAKDPNWLVQQAKSNTVENIDGVYFVQRSPHIFEIVVLQTYVTGRLHAPKWLCTESVLDELRFWRLDLDCACSCCAQESKHDPDNDADSETDHLLRKEGSLSSWEKFRRKGWNFCEYPSSSWAATIFSIVSLLFVLLSSAVFVAGTMPSMQCTKDHFFSDGTQTDSNLNESSLIIINSTNPFNISARNASDLFGNFSLIAANQTDDDGNDDDIDIPGFFSSCSSNYYLEIMECICVAAFTLELLMRLAFCPSYVQFFMSPLNIIDIMATIPFYIEVTLTCVAFEVPQMRKLHGVFVFIRILRTLRVFRILKLARYFEELRILGKTLQAAKSELAMLMLFTICATFIFASILYQLEKDVASTPFTSIPAACWWGIVTLTTVGYGDTFPATIPGKIVAGIACVTGIIMTAFPVSVLVEHFTVAYKQKSKKKFFVRRLRPSIIDAKFSSVIYRNTKTEQT